MAVNIIPVELPTLFPITGNLGGFKLAGTTIEKLIISRFPVAVTREIQVRADFIPSGELAARLFGGVAAKVIDPVDGVCLAQSGGADEEHCVLSPDNASRRIVYPWDLLALNEELLRPFAEPEIRGTVRAGATIDGVVHLGEGSVILPGVYIEGNVSIGKNCKIGPNCYLRGSTSIADSCHVGQGVEIKNSILEFHVSVGHLSYVGDSIICDKVNFGAGTVISNLRHDGLNHRYRLNGQLVETGRRKFGAIIGTGVHTGINTSIYPGRCLSPDSMTRPGEIVEHSK